MLKTFDKYSLDTNKIKQQAKTNFLTHMSSITTDLSNGFYNTVHTIENFASSANDFFFGIVSDLGNWFANVGQWFAELPQKLVDAFKELFELLFVPEGDMLTKMRDNINAKFPIIDQVKELSNRLMNFNYGDSPAFTITYNGVEYPIVDLSSFVEYRQIINVIIVAICYFLFVMRLVKRIPRIIGVI